MRMEQRVVPQHLSHVGTGFSNTGDFAVFYPMDPGIIGRQG